MCAAPERELTRTLDEARTLGLAAREGIANPRPAWSCRPCPWLGWARGSRLGAVIAGRRCRGGLPARAARESNVRPAPSASGLGRLSEQSASTYPASRREPWAKTEIRARWSSQRVRRRAPFLALGSHRTDPAVGPSSPRHPRTSWAGGARRPIPPRRGRHRRRLVAAAVAQQRPGRARQLGRERHDGCVRMRPRRRAAQPSVQPRVGPRQGRHRGSRALGQQLAHAIVAAFGGRLPIASTSRPSFFRAFTQGRPRVLRRHQTHGAAFAASSRPRWRARAAAGLPGRAPPAAPARGARVSAATSAASARP